MRNENYSHPTFRSEVKLRSGALVGFSLGEENGDFLPGRDFYINYFGW